jgi:hypothetical protein
MNLYSKEESEKIEKRREANEKMEDFFSKKREDLLKEINPLISSLSLDMSLSENPKKLLDSQAIALSLRLQINEQVNYFLNKRTKESIILKKLKQEKFIFYATSFGVKTNMGEKVILIEAHLGEYERAVLMIESHIDFLRETVKSLESFGYSIKNMIELYSLLSRQ